MFPLGASKTAATLVGSPTNGATGTAQIDRLNFDYVSIDLVMATADVVSNKPSVLKISESDTTDATNYADITGLVGGTDFTIPNADTSNPNIYRFNIDCRARKRYLKVTVSPRTTQQTVVVSRLGRGREWPINTTLSGCTAFVEL